VVTRYRRHAGSLSHQSSDHIVVLSGHFRQAVVKLFFPAMPEPEQRALTDGLSRLIGGGRRWIDAVYAMSHAVALAPAVPRIDPAYMIAQLQNHLLHMIEFVVQKNVMDYETLEMMTDTNAHFEAWRMAAGGALDREIMARLDGPR
jgi:hypothetical protein